MRALTGTDPDRLKEEQARGITIDLGFAHLEIGGVNLAFVDVPGHERFVKNMLAGVGGIDLVMLVVAADESVMPQTREHFDICRLLEVPAGLIVLTKADLVDAEMLELARLEVRELVAGLVPRRRADRRGVVEDRRGSRRAARRAGVARRPSSRRGAIDGAARLPIDRVFSMKGFGTVVTGTLVSGRIREDDELTLLPRGPGGEGARAAGARPREGVAEAGRRVAVNLGGVDVDGSRARRHACDAGAFEPTRRLDAASICCPMRGRCAMAPGAVPPRDDRAARPRRARAPTGATRGDGATRVAGVPAGVRSPGASAYARIRLEGPAVLTRGDRFILRAYSPAITIGGGVVLDPHPPRSPIRNAAAAARFRAARCRQAVRRTATTAPCWRSSTSAGAAGLRVARAGEPRRPGSRGRACGRTATRAAGSVVARRACPGVARGAAGPRRHDCVAALDRTPQGAAAVGRAAARRSARAPVRECGRAACSTTSSRRWPPTAASSARDRLALAGHQLSLSPRRSARARGDRARCSRTAGLAPPDRVGAARSAGLSPAGRRASREAAGAAEDARQDRHAALSRRCARAPEASK